MDNPHPILAGEGFLVLKQEVLYGLVPEFYSNRERSIMLINLSHSQDTVGSFALRRKRSARREVEQAVSQASRGSYRSIKVFTL